MAQPQARLAPKERERPKKHRAMGALSGIKKPPLKTCQESQYEILRHGVGRQGTASWGTSETDKTGDAQESPGLSVGPG
jgi:hypothetical protein